MVEKLQLTMGCGLKATGHDAVAAMYDTRHVNDGLTVELLIGKHH